jgi:hypothetical protein
MATLLPAGMMSWPVVARSMIAGGGAPEAEVSQKLAQYARTIPGIQVGPPAPLYALVRQRTHARKSHWCLRLLMAERVHCCLCRGPGGGALHAGTERGPKRPGHSYRATQPACQRGEQRGDQRSTCMHSSPLCIALLPRRVGLRRHRIDDSCYVVCASRRAQSRIFWRRVWFSHCWSVLQRSPWQRSASL